MRTGAFEQTLPYKGFTEKQLNVLFRPLTSREGL